MTQEDWLTSHPFLRPIAALHAHVEGVVDEVCTSFTPGIQWDSYIDDFLAGIPLLRVQTDAIDFVPAEKMLRSLIQKLTDSTLNDKLSKQVRMLQEELGSSAENAVCIAARLASGAPVETSYPGLLRYLGWRALSRYLSPLVSAFETWSERNAGFGLIAQSAGRCLRWLI